MSNYLKATAITVLILCTAAVFAAEQTCGTFVGQTRQLGNGTAYSWVTLDHKEKPQAIGITFTEAALTGLPETHAEYELLLPPQASATPIKVATLDWNPTGHIPPGIYDVPHFDLHFYLISNETREKITATGEDLEKIRQQPEPRFVPPDYIFAPGGEEPRMGGHWVDSTAPELHGKPFTQTFIYGFYEGRMIFLEPMVAVSYLNTKPNKTEKIKQPSAFPEKGYYPTKYTVKYDPVCKEYTVSLSGMVLR